MARKEKPTFITETEPFPQRLKSLLEERGVTQTEIASFIGCTRQAISLYVTGQSTPDINILTKISNYFHVSADYLLGLTDVKTTDINVRSICEYLHITEECVHQLHTNKENYLNSLVDDFSNKVKSMF